MSIYSFKDKNCVGGWSKDDQPVYRTTKAMFALGMCVCDSCGKMHSVDYKFCSKCLREVFIDLTKDDSHL